jgi:hypothetical protein
VAGADVIIVAVPAAAHEDVARRLAAHLDDRHVVVVAPGTLGAFVMAREITRAGGRLPRAFVETGTFPYQARQTGPAAVHVAQRVASLQLGAFPAARSTALAAASELFPSARPSVDILDAALTDGGPVLHPALVLLNLGGIDQGRDIDLTASARRLVDAVDAERGAARAGWGYSPVAYALAAGDGAVSLDGPVSLTHRYVTEDAADAPRVRGADGASGQCGLQRAPAAVRRAPGPSAVRPRSGPRASGSGRPRPAGNPGGPPRGLDLVPLEAGRPLSGTGVCRGRRFAGRWARTLHS